MQTDKQIDFTTAADRARHIRELYKQLEKRLHGSAWTPQEVMLGYLSDVGELGRLVMAKEGRWLHGPRKFFSVNLLSIKLRVGFLGSC